MGRQYPGGGQPELLPLDAEPPCLRSCHAPCARPYRVYLGVVLTLFGVLVGGCARPPTHDPGKAELLRQIREAYLFDIDVADLDLLSVPEIVARLDPDTRLIEVRRRMSPDFIRGFEPEGSVVAMRALSDGRGYLRLAFFGRRTLENLRKARNDFFPPLCALTIDLRDNDGGNFGQALRLAELFLPLGAPLTSMRAARGAPCCMPLAQPHHARND